MALLISTRMKRFFASIGYRILRFSNRFEKNETYHIESEFAFAQGATLAGNILRTCPERVDTVYVRTDVPPEKLHEETLEKARKADFKPVFVEGPVPGRIKRNHFGSIIIRFRKEEEALKPGNHVILVDPVISRNIGAIQRSMLAFGLHDMAIIPKKGDDKIDTYNLDVVRASMGARLKVRTELFKTLEEYRNRFPDNKLYSFMLIRDAVPLSRTDTEGPFTLIFGNETVGLPSEYAEFSEPVFIEQTDEADSLNISNAAAIVMYEYTHR